MEIIVFLSIVIAVVAVLTSIVLVRRVKKQIAEMTDVLVDVKNGNGNRRILSATNELTAPLAYEINEIVVSYESRLSTVRQTEETNRQLMTSLSHDVRTPLTTLIGYLDAAHKGLVTGKDRDDYIETARRKAHDLKEYIDVLFDWFKLNSNEFALEIQSVEAAELTRNILIDWIAALANPKFALDNVSVADILILLFLCLLRPFRVLCRSSQGRPGQLDALRLAPGNRLPVPVDFVNKNSLRIAAMLLTVALYGAEKIGCFVVGIKR